MECKGLKRVLLCLLFLVLFPTLTTAQEFPSKPVTITVVFSAGGTTDITTRALAGKSEKCLGQPLIITNRGGGGGTVMFPLPPDIWVVF